MSRRPRRAGPSPSPPRRRLAHASAAPDAPLVRTLWRAAGRGCNGTVKTCRDVPQPRVGYI
eukprot:3696388-Prymnesium_polylepis.1